MEGAGPGRGQRDECSVLALCGSLRARSSNRLLLMACSRIAVPTLCVRLWPRLDLPLFNPDLEPAPPRVVLDFQRAVEASDALLIASPEYAHGVTGTIKNALDWLVGLERFAGKPVAVLNASSRAQIADLALRETLRTMAARLVEPACVTIAVPAGLTDAAELLADPERAAALRVALTHLADAAQQNEPGESGS